MNRSPGAWLGSSVHFDTSEFPTALPTVTHELFIISFLVLRRLLHGTPPLTTHIPILNIVWGALTPAIPSCLFWDCAFRSASCSPGYLLLDTPFESPAQHTLRPPWPGWPQGLITSLDVRQGTGTRVWTRAFLQDDEPPKAGGGLLDGVVRLPSCKAVCDPFSSFWTTHHVRAFQIQHPFPLPKVGSSERQGGPEGDGGSGPSAPRPLPGPLPPSFPTSRRGVVPPRAGGCQRHGLRSGAANGIPLTADSLQMRLYIGRLGRGPKYSARRCPTLIAT